MFIYNACCVPTKEVFGEESIGAFIEGSKDGRYNTFKLHW